MFDPSQGANAMAGHQQDEVASATATKGDRDTTGLQSKQEPAQDRRIQDMLEDDDVREALRLRHIEKPAGRGPAQA
jgi:hypothetical protein